MDHSDFENAYRAFRQVIASGDIPDLMPFPYESCERIEKSKWHLFAGFGVASDLRSAINMLNAWKMRLEEWSAWMNVLELHEEQHALELQFHFLNHLMFFCMFQPSGFRDALAQVATQAVHQGNLRTGKTDRDELQQDKLKPGRHLKRPEVEAQLRQLCAHWTTAPALIEHLAALDSMDYRRLTFDYRNRASHAVPPSFGWGEVGFVTRSVGPWQEMVDQGDGTFQFEDRKSVRYSFGGMPPLELKETYRASLREHDLASRALDAYCALLDEIMQA